MVDFALLGWIAIGLTVGTGSKLAMPALRSGSWTATLLVSTAGAILDGWGASHLFDAAHASRGSGLIAPAIGAVIMLVIYRFVFRLDTTR